MNNLNDLHALLVPPGDRKIPEAVRLRHLAVLTATVRDADQASEQRPQSRRRRPLLAAAAVAFVAAAAVGVGMGLGMRSTLTPPESVTVSCHLGPTTTSGVTVVLLPPDISPPLQPQAAVAACAHVGTGNSASEGAAQRAAGPPRWTACLGRDTALHVVPGNDTACARLGFTPVP